MASIRDDGLLQPIVTFKGKILDGRNRALACTNAQVKPTYKKFTGTKEDALKYVMKANLIRRHLTASQRSVVASKMANLKQGEKANPQPSSLKTKPKVSPEPSEAPITVTEAAKMLNVSPASVKRAKTVLASGDQDLIVAVERGEITVNAAAKQAKPPAPKPTQNVDDIDCQRILKVWDKAGKGGRALFLEAIGVKNRQLSKDAQPKARRTALPARRSTVSAASMAVCFWFSIRPS